MSASISAEPQFSAKVCCSQFAGTNPTLCKQMINAYLDGHSEDICAVMGQKA